MKRFALLSFVLAMMLVLSVPASAGCLECAVKTYVKALNARDLDKVVSLFADEVEWAGPDWRKTLDKNGVREMLGWDAATHASVAYENLEWEGDVVRGLFTERNDFYALLGLDEQRFRLVFRFEDDLIREIRLAPDDASGSTLSKALEPFLAWASSRHPDRLEAIYPGGQFVYDADSAEKWLALLREWRAS
jgi:hypothetical protein